MNKITDKQMDEAEKEIKKMEAMIQSMTPKVSSVPPLCTTSLYRLATTSLLLKYVFRAGTQLRSIGLRER